MEITGRFNSLATLGRDLPISRYWGPKIKLSDQMFRLIRKGLIRYLIKEDCLNVSSATRYSIKKYMFSHRIQGVLHMKHEADAIFPEDPR